MVSDSADGVAGPRSSASWLQTDRMMPRIEPSVFAPGRRKDKTERGSSTERHWRRGRSPTGVGAFVQSPRRNLRRDVTGDDADTITCPAFTLFRTCSLVYADVHGSA